MLDALWCNSGLELFLEEPLFKEAAKGLIKESNMGD